MRTMLESRLSAVALFASALAVAAQQPAPPAPPTTLAAGISLTDGNTDSTQVNGSWLTELKPAPHEWRFGAEGNYSETEDTKSSDNAKGFIGYRYLFTDRWFAAVNLSAMYDQIADIDYRYMASPGIGYYLVKTGATSLTLEAGPAFIWEEVGGEQDDIVALRGAERFEHTFGTGAKIWQAVEYMPDTEDFDSYLLNAEAGAEAMLTQQLSLRLVVKDQYDSTPAPGREENDVSVVGSIGVKF